MFGADKEERARIKAAKKAAKKNKRHWWENFRDAYQLVTEEYPVTRWIIWGSVAGFLLLGIVLSAVTGRWVTWLLLGILLALLVPLVVLTVLVRRASYKRVDGMPGAAGGALSQLGRGWVTRDEPVEFTGNRKNFVFRAVGKPGVVLVAEGTGELSSLMRSAAKQVNQIVPSAPVITMYVGHGEKQVLLKDLNKKIKKLPKRMTAQEVADTAQRLDAAGANTLPIPKGIDPTRMRMASRSRFR